MQSLEAQDRDSEKVHIGIRITAFSEQASAQKIPRIRAPKAMERLLLKARLAQNDDFYVNHLHIKSKPRGVDKNQKYTVQLSFHQTSPRGHEELIGTMELQGALHKIGMGYELHGIAEKRFDDRDGLPILNVLAGFKPSQMHQAPKTASL